MPAEVSIMDPRPSPLRAAIADAAIGVVTAAVNDADMNNAINRSKLNTPATPAAILRPRDGRCSWPCSMWSLMASQPVERRLLSIGQFAGYVAGQMP